MSVAISSPVRKLVALCVLILLLWATMNIALSYLQARSALHEDIGGLEDDYRSIVERRVDVRQLERQLWMLITSPAAQRSAIVADTDREALNKLMETARESLQPIKAQLLAVTEVAPSPGPSTVGVHLRARTTETQLPHWLTIIDGGTFRPHLEELAITSQAAGGDKTTDLEVSATLEAGWVSPKDRGP